MNYLDILNTIQKDLCMIKADVFCTYKDFHNILNNILCDLLNKKFNNYNHFCDNINCNKYCDDECCKCSDKKCVSIIDFLICYTHYIEENTNCHKNYGYLAQVDRLKCILKNLETLLCQLKCLCVKDCDLLSEVLCLIYDILQTLENIISRLNNIECLCKLHSKCKSKTLECLLCGLVEDITKLEEKVYELGHLVLEITSSNIINCTPCTVSTTGYSCKTKDYAKDYCDSYYDKCKQKKYFK